MNITLIATSVAAGLFGGMLILTELGRRIGAARLARDSEGLAKGVGVVEGAVFGLLGLLLAFTFSGAAARFEARRHLVTEEANAIGTAYLRVDLLPADAQPEIRDLFRRYVDLRASAFANTRDFPATQRKLDDAVRLQGEIWTQSLAACRRPEGPSKPPSCSFRR